MSNWVRIPLSMQSYQAATLPASAQRLLNMYPEVLPEGSKGPAALLPTPGMAEWGTIGSGPIRGMIVMGDYLWVVTGEELYQVDPSGIAVLIGAISGTRDCFMTENGTHVGIAADSHVYAANASGVTEVSVQRMNGATYQDGYGVFTLEGTQSFYLTELDDMTSISALDFSTADAFPDTVMGCISHNRQLVIYKEKSAEIWDNVGAASFPFQRSPGGFIDRGCKASASIAKTEDTVAWLADDLTIRALGGYRAQRISTPAIELLIQQVADPTSARGFTYAQNGHTFYCVSFETLSVAYDFVTGKWHERETYGDNRWRAHHYAYFADKNLVSEYDDNDIKELDDAAYSDEDGSQQRVFTSGVINSDGLRAYMDEVYLEAEAGVGEGGGGGDDDPSLFLECSDDGGFTWSTPREAKLGKLGEYSKRVHWTRLGMFRHQRVLRFSTRANVKVAATGCMARIAATP